MNPNQGRESAYVTSRVKDLSLITNTPDYVGLFACITPRASSTLEEAGNVVYLDVNGEPTDDHSEENKVYLPQLVRDVDSLTELFGDPRVDPKTYRDLYTIRYIVQNGFACYVAKVRSGKSYEASVNSSGLFDYYSGSPLYNNQLDNPKLSQLLSDISDCHLFTAKSSIVGENTLSLKLIPVKPYSINQVVLEVVFKNRATSSSDEVEVASTRISLAPDTKNADLVKTINAYLGGDVVLHLPEYLDDTDFSTVVDAQDIKKEDENGNKYFCISNLLLYTCGVYSLVPDPDSDGNPVAQDDPNATFENPYLLLDYMAITERMDAHDVVKRGLSALTAWTSLYEVNKETFALTIEPIENASLSFNQSNYTRSLSLYKDPKYAGCFISELSAMVTQEKITNKDIFKPKTVARIVDPSLYKEGNRYYTKKDESKSAVLDFDFQLVGSNVVWSEGQNNNMKLIEEGVNPFEPPQTDKSVVYARTEEAGKYIYTPLVGEQEVGETYYVRKEERYISEEVEEPTSTTEGQSLFEVWEAGVNDTYEKSIWEASTYALVLRGSAIDSGKVDDEVDAVKAAISGNTSVFYIKENDKYVLLKFPNSSITPIELGNNTQVITSLIEMSSDNRRGLHYVIKQVAALRKDLTCIFTTPYHPEEDEDEGIFDLNKACNWVAARGDYTDLFEYGNSQALDYSEQAFYCEMYWSWVKWSAVKFINGLATGSVTIEVPATGFVILNSLSSYRVKGSFYPVAGDQGGVLPDSCTILQNPATKSQRDKLISYRINPIYDTGLRGIQIYGNDTLNPQYTDLSAAHIARTLVQIRSKVDRYSETIKFKLNDKYTWGSWINYVTTRILEPIKAAGGLQWYQVDMGYNTTTRAEIAQRKIRGQVSLQFTQALEIIDLEFVVYASEQDMESNS